MKGSWTSREKATASSSKQEDSQTNRMEVELWHLWIPISQEVQSLSPSATAARIWHCQKEDPAPTSSLAGVSLSELMQQWTRHSSQVRNASSIKVAVWDQSTWKIDLLHICSLDIAGQLQMRQNTCSTQEIYLFV